VNNVAYPNSKQGWIAQAQSDVLVLRQYAETANETRLVRPPVLEVMRKYFALLIPAEYGGAGVDAVTYGFVLAELAKGDPSPALWLAMHAFAMGELDRPEVPTETKRRLFGLGLTEPFCAAISENRSTGHMPSTFTPRDVTATARSGGRWLLLGKKKTVTGYRQSEWMMVFAHLKDSDSARPTTVCLVVPTHKDGMVEGSEWDTVDFMRSTNSNSVLFDGVNVDASSLVFTTENFLTEAVVMYGARTFGYMAAYVGIFERLLEIAIQKLTTRVSEGMEQALSYGTLAAAAIGHADRLASTARLQLKDSLEAYEAGDPYAPLKMLRAKVAIGDLVTHGVPLLSEQVGLTGLMDSEFDRLAKDIRVGALMPPTSSAAEFLAGYMVMGQDPADAPSIR